MKKIAIFILALLATPCSQVFADDEAANRPIVRSSEYGSVYAKSIPDEGYGQKGKTRVFMVGTDTDTLICEYDWYANSIHLGGSGENTLVRFGPWNRGRIPKESHFAIGFYRNGKMIREYSTLEMQNLEAGVSQSVSHYTVFKRTLGFRWLKGNSYVFEVEGVNGKVFSFDLDTGKIL